MKFIRNKKEGKAEKRDMFIMLCLTQSAAAVLIVIIIFAVSRTDKDAFYDITREIEGMFSENFDMGGYFTPSEEKEYNRNNSTSVILQSYNGEASDMDNISDTPLLHTNEKDISQDIDFYSSPVVMPVNGNVTSPYGERIHPIYGGTKFHAGKDIAAPEGSPVYAVSDGTVIAAGTAESAGKYIKIDHGGGETTLYCHCSALYVKAGDKIRKGDVIAAVGQTGLATGPHLHFEYHVNSVAVDPDIILSEAVNVY